MTAGLEVFQLLAVAASSYFAGRTGGITWCARVEGYDVSRMERNFKNAIVAMAASIVVACAVIALCQH